MTDQMTNSALKIWRTKVGVTFTIVLLCFASVLGQAIPPKPNPPRLVNDFSQTLTLNQVKHLEEKLVYYYDTTSIQIAVIFQNGTTRELNEYCTAIIDAWGIGTRGKDNGVLVFVDPQRRQTYIATGRGTEGWLPDALAKRIIDNYMIPAFKEGDYYDGVSSATNIIMKLGAGIYNASDVEKRRANNDYSWLAIFIFIPFFAGWLYVMYQANKYQRMYYSRYGTNDAEFGGGSGGGFFGGGGGGFGGFGGGGSGGGGAGGSW